MEARLREQWEANRRAQAHQWTPEAMAMAWAGITDQEWWNSLPSWERRHIQTLYDAEQIEIEFTGARRIRTYAEAVAKWSPPVDPETERLAQEQAERMAARLALDWSAGRKPSEYTYDPGIAARVSIILGRPVTAIKPRTEEQMNDPKHQPETQTYV